jgi:hypothetical protein
MNRLYWLGVIIAVVCSLSRPYKAVAADKCGSLDRATSAIRLTEVLYPDLGTRELSLQFSEGTSGPPSGPTDVRTFGIIVGQPMWHPPKNKTGDMAESQPVPLRVGDIQLPISFYFEFIDFTDLAVVKVPRCQPVLFRVNNVGQRRMEARSLINAHPEWTDDEDVQAAVKLGMRFGPEKKKAILARIPIKKLSAFYGPLRITSAVFSITLNHLKNPHTDFADLTWQIEAKEIDTGRKLFISVEPFGGEVVSIS